MKFSHADGEGDDPVALTSAERAWGEEAAALAVVVRAVLAAELGLRASDRSLEDRAQEVMRRVLDGPPAAQSGRSGPALDGRNRPPRRRRRSLPSRAPEREQPG